MPAQCPTRVAAQVIHDGQLVLNSTEQPPWSQQVVGVDEYRAQPREMVGHTGIDRSLDGREPCGERCEHAAHTGAEHRLQEHPTVYFHRHHPPVDDSGQRNCVPGRYGRWSASDTCLHGVHVDPALPRPVLLNELPQIDEGAVGASE